MAERKRVYHPETGDPYDPPVAKANDLILNHGWSQTPFDTQAEPLVKTVEPARGTATADDEQSAEDWRGSEVEAEAVEAPVRRRRPRTPE